MAENHNPEPSPSSRDRSDRAHDLHALVERARVLGEQIRVAKTDISTHIMRWLQHLVSPMSIDELLHNEHMCREALNATNPSLRRAALYLVIRHYRLADQFAPLCESWAVTDTDPGVRETATYCLADCFTDSRDQRIGELFASIISNENESEQIRLAAYRGLLRLAALHHSLGSRYYTLTFPGDVDWSIVRTFQSPRD
jgi:hypothetical protein